MSLAIARRHVRELPQRSILKATTHRIPRTVATALIVLLVAGELTLGQPNCVQPASNVWRPTWTGT